MSYLAIHGFDLTNILAPAPQTHLLKFYVPRDPLNPRMIDVATSHAMFSTPHKRARSATVQQSGMSILDYSSMFLS
jgi:hypothetical protein